MGVSLLNAFKILFLLIIFDISQQSAVFAQQVIARSAAEKPTWPTESIYFNYYSGLGVSSSSLSSAKKQAITDALFEINMSKKVLIGSKLETKISEKATTVGGKTDIASIDEAVLEVFTKGETTLIENLSIEDYFWQSSKTKQGIKYEYWVLLKVPKPKYTGQDIMAKQGYGISPIWKSAIIPGWGQRHKGESKKGSKFLIATASAGAATFISFYMNDSYSQKAINEHDVDNRKFYNKWSNQSYTIGIISGLITGGLYGYNIFDAITAPGAKKYAQSSPNENHNIFAVYNGQSAQVILTLYF